MDEPTMRIGQVAHRTGLAPATIRAWQRRYGLLEPARTEGGQRLYSEADVRALLEVSERVASGWALPAAADHVVQARGQRTASRRRAGAAARERGGQGRPAPGTGPSMPPSGPAPTGRSIGGPRYEAATAVSQRQEAAVEPGIDHVVLLVAHDAARALLRAQHPSSAISALVDAVERLGGQVGPASRQTAEVIPVDIGLGEVDPLLPRAEPFSVARLRLEAVLPGLVEDARRLLALLRAAGR